MRRFLPTMLVWTAVLGCALAAQTAEQEKPRITGFVVAPTETDQCRPARISFVLTNDTDEPIYSQRPYSGTTYNLYRTFSDRGFRPLTDRYMVGVSLNGGKDRYPYRWGFRGHLAPGRTTNIVGYLALVEAGTYDITSVLLKGGSRVDSAGIRKAAVTVYICGPAEPTEPVPAREIHPIINGRRYPPMTPYVRDGHLMVAVRPFVSRIGANVYFVRNVVVIRRPGLEILLFPGTQRAIVNGVPVLMPLPTYLYGGVTYAPLRYISPLFGASFYWYPQPRLLFIDGPGVW